MKLLIKGLKLTETITEEWITENCYIAGGACVSYATRSQMHDVDIYFKTKEARDLFVEEIGKEDYVTKKSDIWQSLLIYDNLIENNIINVGDDRRFEELGCSVSSNTRDDVIYYTVHTFDSPIYEYADVAKPLLEKQKWMFRNGYDYVLLERNHFDVNDWDFFGNKSITLKRNNMMYQFILRFYGDPQEMMDETFDFQHCKIAYDLSSRDYIATKETWECLSKRELRYINSFYPISSIKRLYKYGRRGYKWNNDEFVKIIRDIHNVDVNNKFVLEDQLIGYYEDFDYNYVFCNEPLLNGLLVNW